MITMAPAACVLASIGIIELVDALISTDDELEQTQAQLTTQVETRKVAKFRYSRIVISSGILGLITLGYFFVGHAIYAAKEQYSDTGIVAIAKRSSSGLGQRRPFFDDAREAYSWMRLNTPDTSRIVAWWDYGYQVSFRCVSSLVCCSIYGEIHSKKTVRYRIWGIA